MVVLKTIHIGFNTVEMINAMIEKDVCSSFLISIANIAQIDIYAKQNRQKMKLFCKIHFTKTAIIV